MDRPRHKRITHASILKLNYLQVLSFKFEPSHIRGDGCEPKPMRSIPSWTAISRSLSPAEKNKRNCKAPLTRSRWTSGEEPETGDSLARGGRPKLQLHVRARFSVSLQGLEQAASLAGPKTCREMSFATAVGCNAHDQSLAQTHDVCCAARDLLHNTSQDLGCACRAVHRAAVVPNHQVSGLPAPSHHKLGSSRADLARKQTTA